MADIYRLPAISPTMELGTIVAWRIDEGKPFASGDVLLEIGTDKATMEAQIYEDGVLLKQLVAVDDEVPVNAPIAIWGAAGEDVAALVAEAGAELAALKAGGAAPPTEAEEAPPEEAPPEAPAGAQRPPAAEEAVPEARAEPAVQPARAPPPTAGKAPPRPPEKVERTWRDKPLPRTFLDPPGDVRAAGPGRGRAAASPLARKVAADLGVDLSRVKGTGPGGRIVRADVEEASRAPAPATPAAAGPAPAGGDQTLKLTPMRKTIARRLLEVHQTVPTFFLTVDIDASGLVAWRAAAKAADPDVKVGFNDMIMLAVARALRAYPRANASWTDKGIVLHGRVDLGFAVALDEGLITPVVRDADRLSLGALADQVRALAGRARGGQLAPAEYEGNTFTVSNLGMFGIDHFTAILNPPASGILAVGALEEAPVVKDGALVVGHRTKVTMTCDHRAIDGAVGARFLQVLRRYVEQPALMLVS